VLLITVIATALGALVARSLYEEPPRPPASPIVPSPSSVPPSEQPGPVDVQGTADATAHPLFTTLQPLLQRYFDAINAKEYESWKEVVSADRIKETDEATFQRDYRTTRDGNIVIYRIEARGDGNALVMLQFTSTQDRADAPPNFPETCIRWNLVWPFTEQKGVWKLAAGTTSASPQYEKC
jgi:hypothetical protein